MLVARPAIRSLAASKIRELFNAGMGRDDILAFWVGEPDEPTPQFIRQAGMDSIAAGETFYSHNLGILEIREALAAYLSRLHKPAPGLRPAPLLAFGKKAHSSRATESAKSKNPRQFCVNFVSRVFRLVRFCST